MKYMEGLDCSATIKFNRCSQIGNVIQESRMRENLTYGLTRVRGKQSRHATAPTSYSTMNLHESVRFLSSIRSVFCYGLNPDKPEPISSLKVENILNFYLFAFSVSHLNMRRSFPFFRFNYPVASYSIAAYSHAPAKGAAYLAISPLLYNRIF
jgi:hypothetical protein